MQMITKNLFFKTILFATLLFGATPTVYSDDDKREFVDLPEMMQQHQLVSMRDHLNAINEILFNMGEGDLDKAAETAENRLGMTSLKSHHASHMAKFMPEGMRQAGTNMHRAASRFALKAEEGDVLIAYKALQKVTGACVACHAGYKTHGANKSSITPKENKTDTRINLGLSQAEKAQFLAEMRKMLSSIQGVISGIGSNNPEQIIKAARYSGNRMARATPESVKKKTPPAFKEIGGPTHMMFEELIVRAETDDMESLAELTGKLMNQCITCHAMFKANE